VTVLAPSSRPPASSVRPAARPRHSSFSCPSRATTTILVSRDGSPIAALPAMPGSTRSRCPERGRSGTRPWRDGGRESIAISPVNLVAVTPSARRCWTSPAGTTGSPGRTPSPSTPIAVFRKRRGDRPPAGTAESSSIPGVRWSHGLHRDRRDPGFPEPRDVLPRPRRVHPGSGDVQAPVDATRISIPSSRRIRPAVQA